MFPYRIVSKESGDDREIQLDSMLKSDFFYELPKHLIAQEPLTQRTASRLMHLCRGDGHIQHLQFADLSDLVHAGDLLVFNDTKVIPARLFGRKETGGKIEILVERLLSDKCILAQIKASKSPKIGARINIGNEYSCTVKARKEDLFVLEVEGNSDVINMLQHIGRIPLPPYIKRVDHDIDRDRYQTVYADKPGAVAAPTAGLHFDSKLIDELRLKGVLTASLTLHVGSGTFTPLRGENIKDHVMHAEVYEVNEDVIEAIRLTRRLGGRVISVGTTVLRALESASIKGEIRPTRGETRLFIKPGYQFLCVDALLTNFHLPGSTLLILVCAFAGYRRTMEAYCQAVENEYRFFSYGDAMLITND